MHLIGRGRYARSVYPVVPRIAALANRAVAVNTPLDLTGFTPATSPLATNIAARLFTPRSSGIFQVLATLGALNGAGAETYSLAALLVQGTTLGIGGGQVTSNGWRMGADTPVTITGVVSSTLLIAQSISAVGANASQTLNIAALTSPQAVGTPIAILLAIGEAGGGNALAGAFIDALAAYELP